MGMRNSELDATNPKDSDRIEQDKFFGFDTMEADERADIIYFSTVATLTKEQKASDEWVKIFAAHRARLRRYRVLLELERPL